jgi:hypothetical protein
MAETFVNFQSSFNNKSGTDMGGLNAYGKKNIVSGSKEFLMSNTLVAKISFLLLVLICFFILLRLFVLFLTWFFSPNPNPYIVTCRRDGSIPKSISTNPSDKESVPILRSRNEREGLEFTWSVWVFLKGPQVVTSTSSCSSAGAGGEAPAATTTTTSFYHIFSKGSINAENSILHKQNTDATPGLYIRATQNGNVLKNELVVVVSTFTGTKTGERDELEDMITIGNLPTGKWINVIIRVKDKQLDSYINGQLKRRLILKSLPRQNYGDIYLSQKGENVAGYGFNGEISSLRYFNSALNPVEINSIVRVGPNMCTDETNKQTPPYFSHKWYDNE